MTQLSKEDLALKQYMVDSRVPSVDTCDIQHSTSTISGNTSCHVMWGTDGEGLAVDFAPPGGGELNSGLMAIYDAFIGRYQNIRELFYAGAPYQVKNGVKIPTADYDQDVVQEHKNHVHVAVFPGHFLHFNGSITPIGGATMAGKTVAILAAAGSGNNDYWQVQPDGGVISHGQAQFHGSMGGKHMNAPVTCACATPDRGGYWLIGADGGVFAFGNADAGLGSFAGKHLGGAVTGVACTPTGKGLWLTCADGGVLTLGDAQYAGNDL